MGLGKSTLHAAPQSSKIFQEDSITIDATAALQRLRTSLIRANGLVLQHSTCFPHLTCAAELCQRRCMVAKRRSEVERQATPAGGASARRQQQVSPGQLSGGPLHGCDVPSSA